MKCLFCKNPQTKVIETREAGDALRRRRECLACEQRFTTYERVEKQQLRIVKRDGSREFFNRDKLKHGLLVACEKRPVSQEQIENAVAEIEKELRGKGDLEVPSREVGEVAMKYVRSLDEVAYIRFASVYKQFKDIESFKQEIDELSKQ